MVQISIINMKENEKNFLLGIKKFNPIKKNLKLYMIKLNSNEPTHINFCMCEKLMKNIQIKHKKTTYKYHYIPSDGILISCIITEKEPLEMIFEPIDLCSEIIIKQVKKKIQHEITLTNIKWDNIFIINLKRRADRKNSMIEKLNQQKITKYEFIEGIDGNELEIQKKFINIQKNKKTFIINSGHFACLLSHINAIKLAKSRNYSNIMILEDDVYFCDNFETKLSNLLIPNYDMIYLGGIIKQKKLFFNEWVNTTNIMGAYGYILSSNLFDIILTQLEKLIEYVDVFYMKKIQPNYSTILLFDYIKTDIATSDTSYKSKSLIKRLSYIKIK